MLVLIHPSSEAVEAFNSFVAKPDAKTLENDLMVQYAKSVDQGYADTDAAMKLKPTLIIWPIKLGWRA